MSESVAVEADPKRWRALWICLIAGFMTLLDVSIVNVALPSMEHGVGATPSDVSWVVSGYALTFGLALVPAGKLGDDYGRRRMFLLGLLLFVLTSALCGAAPNATMLVIGRLCQGIAGGLLNPQVIGMIQQLFQGRERGKAFGFFGATVGLSTAVGPVLGGLLIQVFGMTEGWRYVFYVNLPIGLLAILFGLRLLPKDVRSGRRRMPDLLGTLLLGAAVVLVMLPLVRQEEQSGDPMWWLIGVAAGLLLVFVLWEHWLGKRGWGPLVNLKLLTVRSYSMGAVLGLVYFAGFTGIFLVSVLFFQQGLGYSALQSGAAMLAFAIGSAISPTIGGRLVHRFGRPMVVAGNLLVAVGLAVTAYLVRNYDGGGVALVLAGPLFVAGFGSGLVIAPNSTLALEEVPPSEGGTAAGMLQTGQRVGAAIGTALGGSLFFTELGRTHGDYHAAASLGLLGSTVLVTLALLFGIADVLLSRRRRAAPESPAAEALAAEEGWVEPERESAVTGTVLGLGPDETALVALTSLETHEVHRSTTGPDGQYAVDVPVGTYALLVNATDREPVARIINFGGAPIVEDVELHGAVRLVGTVHGDQGGAVPGARVSIVDATGHVQRVVATDEQGRYEVDGLAPGQYTVVTTGYSPAASPVTIAAGEDVTFDPVLQMAD